MQITPSLLFRQGLFLIIAGFLIFSPLLAKDKETKYLLITRWFVYRGAGKDLLDLKYFQTLGESQKPIDLNQVLESDDLELLAPRILLDMKTLKNLSEKICTRLGPKADIKLIGRRATVKGWIVFSDGNKNICNDT